MFDDKKIEKVSVVIPVYNEQESLPALIQRTNDACKTLNLDYEILLVDDGSQDASAVMIADAASLPDSHIVAVLLNRNYGQHSAIMAGFSHVSGDLIITLDADLQNPLKRSRVWLLPLRKATTLWEPCARTARTAGSVVRPHALSIR